MLELHCHTTCSDGTLSPGELVALAAASGVRAIAITDHDTLSGWDEARMACEGHGLELVPGLELSTIHNGSSLHILGFYPDPDRLGPFLEERHAARVRRAVSIVQRLEDLGYPVELPKVPTPGRFHIARALVEAGYIDDEQVAFRRWIGEGGPAYVPYEHLSATEGIRHLRECGAVTSWAHPLLFRGGTVAEVLPALVESGLDGIEVYHSEHTPRQSARLESTCAEWGLVATGGSDYHGDNKVGVTLNMLKLPLSLLEPIKRLAERPVGTTV